MAPTGTLAAALDALPLWWPDATDAAAFDAAFTGWARAGGWRAAGFVWPVESNPTVVKTFPAAGVEPVPPAEVAAIAGRLRAGEPTVLVNGTRNRVYALVAPRGLPAGLLWAEKLPTDGWADADRAYLALAAQTVARSPALAAVAGPVVDPDALSRRLADATASAYSRADRAGSPSATAMVRSANRCRALAWSRSCCGLPPSPRTDIVPAKSRSTAYRDTSPGRGVSASNTD